MNKRQKIIIAAILLTIGLLFAVSHNNLFYRVQFVLGLGVLAYLISLWALWEGMTRLKAVVLLTLPAFFTIAMASFAYLLPLRWLVRMPFAVFYGLCTYFILLSQNVFSVAAIRTIPLYRAASTVSFLFTLITAFLLYSVVYSLNLPFFWNALAIFVITFPLVLQIIWSVEMESLDSRTIVTSFVVTLITAQFALALSFWPVATTMWSLFLASSLYVMLGVMTEQLRDRLTSRIAAEYLAIGVVIFLFTSWFTSWTG